MQVKRIFSLVVLFAVIGSGLFAQDLMVEAKKVRTRTTSHSTKTTEVLAEDGEILSSVVMHGPESEAVESQANIVKVTTLASNVRVTAEDVNRNPVLIKKLDETRYGIGASKGPVWVRVTAIDFGAAIFDEQVIVVEPVRPPAPPDVDNQYGVGKVAATFAPANDKAGRELVADQYRQAADFLFGIPSLKTVSSQNGTDANSNVFAWLKQQAGMMQCPDQETCKQWGVFRAEIAKALVESQKQRQYTRQDWFNAFNEISKGVER